MLYQFQRDSAVLAYDRTISAVLTLDGQNVALYAEAFMSRPWDGEGEWQLPTDDHTGEDVE